MSVRRVYGDKQQREIGEAVKKAVAHGVQRSELFVATKIPCCPGSAFINSCAGTAGMSHATMQRYMCPRGQLQGTKAVEHNLAVLGLDYIDLMLMHDPSEK